MFQLAFLTIIYLEQHISKRIHHWLIVKKQKVYILVSYYSQFRFIVLGVGRVQL